MNFSLDQGKAVLRRTPATLAALLRDLPASWTSCDEGPATWSPYMVVGHLVYLEEADWMDRTRVILGHGTSGTFAPIDRTGGFERFSGWTLEALLERFATTRAANLTELDDVVTTEHLDRWSSHPDFGEVTLSELLATWVVHDLNHIGQIVKTMGKQYANAVGPWRAYLPIIDAP